MAKFDTARLAPLASPVFTGDPQSVTPAAADNDTSVATTSFVKAAIAAGGGGGSASITISDTPPSSPANGALWWESDSGTLFIYYTDANSSQWVAIGSTGGGLGPQTLATQPLIRVFTSSQSYVPSSNLISAIVECVGGGGGGGYVVTSSAYTGAGGGGSGAYSRKVLTAAQIGASQTITIGAAGAGSTSNVAGANGGDTSFGSLCVAKGGTGGGGVNAANQLGGAGGLASGGTGDVTADGMPGGSSGQVVTYQIPAGAGGSSFLGGGARPIQQGTAGGLNGLNAGNYGSGGGGGFQATSGTGNGGNGSPGICIVTEFVALAAQASVPIPTRTLLATYTPGVVNSVVIDSSIITATYDWYEIWASVFMSSGVAASLAFQGSKDNGATWIAGSSDYYSCPVYAGHAGAGSVGGGAVGSAVTVTTTVDPGLANVPQDVFIKIMRPTLASTLKIVRFETGSYGGSTFYTYTGHGAIVGDQSALNALRLVWTGGQTFAAKSLIKVYGCN